MQPRWYQQEAVDACWQYLCQHDGGSPVIVLPTGAGKSLVIAMLARDVVERYQRRVLVVAHRKELLEQNADKVRRLLPDHSVGIYSAGLKQRDQSSEVVCCGIQSAFKRAHEFGPIHLALLDEVHLVPSDGEGMYRTFLNDLKAVNPAIRFVGLTATPFRTGEGRLTGKDKLFQKVCYSAPVLRLINEGYLCKVVSPKMQASVDTSVLHVRGGEFIAGEVENLFNADQIVTAACREIVDLTKDRRSILTFCSGVYHAEHVKRVLEAMTGEEVGIVTGQTMALERAATLRRFKDGELRWCVNVDVLTTGFDAPNIDAIAILRATLSPGLFAQMVGRGLRTDPRKADCLVLDFGENLKRHGAIDDPGFGVESQKRGGDGTSEAVMKQCPACEEEVYAGVRECECGYRFPPPKSSRHQDEADKSSDIIAGPVRPQCWYVEEANWSLHRKRGAGDEAPPTLRMNYLCCRDSVEGEPHGNLEQKTISEWVCLQHTGFARTKAENWWRTRSIAPVPDTISEALDLLDRGAVAIPRRITTLKDGKFERITACELEEIPETWHDEADESELIEVNGFAMESDEIPF